MEPTRIAVTGAAGQLGHSLCQTLGAEALPLTRRELDLTQLGLPNLAELLDRLRPQAIIHCAAYTAVDKAESESELCQQVNAGAVETLTRLCGERGILLVQISTDYVFGQPGDRPRRETDATFADSTYARSKLTGEEHALREPRNLVVRTCGLYAAPPQGVTWANFPNTMLRVAAAGKPLRVVNDQHCTPSYAPHVAQAVAWLCRQALAGKAAGGVYHVVNSGATTWYEFACELFRQAGLKPDVTPIPSAEYPTPVRRPSYSVLATAKYASVGGPPLPTWQDALGDYLAARSATLAAAGQPAGASK